MSMLFELLKGIFFFVTILIGLFFTKGQLLIQNNNTYTKIWKIIMPGYLIFIGVMIGYIIGMLRCVQKDIKEDDKQKRKSIYIQSFIIGSLIGLGLAMLYIFVLS